MAKNPNPGFRSLLFLLLMLIPSQVSAKPLDISGHKSFELKKTVLDGDLSLYTRDHFDSPPGEKLEQSLHLELDGDLGKRATIKGVFDDNVTDRKTFLVDIKGDHWSASLGDLKIEEKETLFTVYSKGIRGAIVEGNFHDRGFVRMVASRADGWVKREIFPGRGDLQDYRLGRAPVVENSERVTLDDRLLVRGIDYSLDPDDGTLKIKPIHLPIHPNQKLVVEYEYRAGESDIKRYLLGVRGKYQEEEKGHLGFSWYTQRDARTGNIQKDATPLLNHWIGDLDFSLHPTPTWWIKGEGGHSDYRIGERTASGATEIANSLNLAGRYANATWTLLSEWQRIEPDYHVIGRDGVAQVSEERPLVDDLLFRRFAGEWRGVQGLLLGVERQLSDTNLNGNPDQEEIEFSKTLGRGTYQFGKETSLQFLASRQEDRGRLRDAPSSRHDKDNLDFSFSHFWKSLDTRLTGLSGFTKQRELLKPGEDILKNSLTLSRALGEWFQTSIGLENQSHRLAERGDRTREDQSLKLSLTFNKKQKLTGDLQGLFHDLNNREKGERERSVIADGRIRWQPLKKLKIDLKLKQENANRLLKSDLTEGARATPEQLLEKQKAEREGKNLTVALPTAVATTLGSVNFNFSPTAKWNTQLLLRGKRVTSRNEASELQNSRGFQFNSDFSPDSRSHFLLEWEEEIRDNQLSLYHETTARRDLSFQREFSRGLNLTQGVEWVQQKKQRREDSEKFVAGRMQLVKRLARAWQGDGLLVHSSYQWPFPSTQLEKTLKFIYTPAKFDLRATLFLYQKNRGGPLALDRDECGLQLSHRVGSDTSIEGEAKRVNSREGRGATYTADLMHLKVNIDF